MPSSQTTQNNDQPIRRILSIDGGGIRGIFPATVLAELEKELDQPIGSYFDLIAGTSTGGIIAIGLGLGKTAAELQSLYEEHGPRIFSQPFTKWQKVKGFVKHFFGTKHRPDVLREVLHNVLGDRCFGESTNRLLIPAWDAESHDVYIYKTAYHKSLSTDYRVKAIDVALATTAAPTYFPPHIANSGQQFIDGGVWANNPTGIAAVEAVGKLRWPAETIRILSISTITEQPKVHKAGGIISTLFNSYIIDLFMRGQNVGAMGIANVLTGHNHRHKSIWRIDQTSQSGRFSLDNTAFIQEMKGRAVSETRKNKQEILEVFFTTPAEPFTPEYSLEENK